MRPPATGRRGFSMIEVVMALGVAAFCLVILMALLPVGINSDKATSQQTIASHLADAAMADLREAPLATQSYLPAGVLYSPRFRFALPAAAGGAPQTVYVADDGTPLTVPGANLPAGTAVATYRVNVLGPARPATTGTQPQRGASPVYILVTWPGQADPAAAQWPSHYAGTFEAVAYLDQN